MILESIVTTIDDRGIVNIAPMGPMVDPDSMRGSSPSFILRPWDGSRTCANLLRSRRAVVHVTDDAALIAAAAIGSVGDDVLTVPVGDDESPWRRLVDCHRWFATSITPVDRAADAAQCERFGLHQQPRLDGRHELWARTMQQGVERPFFGFNRAKHAVIEAAILATRIQHLAAEEIQSQLEVLGVAVEKTGGSPERDAMQRIVEHVRSAVNTSVDVPS